MQLCHKIYLSICYTALILIFGFLEEIIEKIIESRYIGIFLFIGKIIDIDIRHPKFIGDLKELSTKLSISKMMGYLSKTYRYRKK